MSGFCDHPKFGDGHCGEAECPNRYTACMLHNGRRRGPAPWVCTHETFRRIDDLVDRTRRSRAEGGKAE